MNQEQLYKILLGPHVTNKTYELSEKSSYVVFKVKYDADKKNIKKAVELIFDVKVTQIKTINVKGKSRKFGRIQGKTKKMKKAYIKLAKGYEINFISSE